MDIQLKTTGRVDVYDVITGFAVTAPAKGLQKLCQFAETNGNRLDEQTIVNQYRLPPGAARNLYINGQQSGVWDDDGRLTSDGHETSSTGEVLVKERGPLRIWVFENPTTGPVLLHAARRGNLPYGDAEPQVKHSPKVLQHLSDGYSRQGLLDREVRRWQLHWTEKGSSWSIVEKFCQPAHLTWYWTLDDNGNWIMDDELILTCKLSGTTGNKENDGQTVMDSYPPTGALDPASSIRDWLSKGRFSKGPWDAKLMGLKRPFSELGESEKTRFTTDEMLDSEADGWDEVAIKSIPLIARTLEDASDWAGHILLQQTPAYTTTERTERVLTDILEEEPFKSVDTEKVYDRVLKRLTTDRSNNPRLSKYLFAGDDLDAVAFVSATIENSKRNEYTAILNSGEGYDEFIQQLTNKMKGEIKTIWYVDRYAVQTRARKKLVTLVESFRQTLGGVKFSLLTSFDPYGEGDRDRNQIHQKMKQICDSVHFMEDRDIAPHNRYVVIQTDKEVRWWSLPDGLLAGMERQKSASKYEPGRGVEEVVSAFIDNVGKKKKGA
jgi:hypothetical protein